MGKYNQLMIFLCFLLKTIENTPLGFSGSGGSGSDNPTTAIKTPLNNLGDLTNRKIQQIIEQKTISFVPKFPDSGRKHAVLEQESLDSSIKTKYGNLQQFVGGFFNPQPIVDTISEYEKYGNDGGKHRIVAVGVVAGFEGLSNALNAAVDAPFQVVQQIGKKITTSLNPVGGKLVGLA